MQTIYPVIFGGTEEHIVFVGFDAAAALDYADAENNEAECEILRVEELPLVDNFGFPCERKEAGFVAPWLAKVSDACAKWYAPESWARYVREMSVGG